MILKLIVAHDKNLVIGNKGKLPWHISEDLKLFKRTTMGKPILMGRGVFEEIGCKPLPGRRNVVLSKTRVWEGVESYPSISEALKALENEETVFVIGGGQIYKELLGKCDYLYVSLVEGEYEGDVFFPEYRQEIGKVWIETEKQKMDGFTFHLFKRMHNQRD